MSKSQIHIYNAHLPTKDAITEKVKQQHAKIEDYKGVIELLKKKCVDLQQERSSQPSLSLEDHYRSGLWIWEARN